MAVHGISRILTGLAAGTAASLFPGVASAQPVTVGAASLAWSKSEAILGAPSALESILARAGRGRAGLIVASAGHPCGASDRGVR